MGDLPVQPHQTGATRFEIGVATVVHSLPFANCVIVESPGRPPRPALLGSALGHGGHGSRETRGIVPGTRVACLFAVDSPTEAYVLCALADPVADAGKAPLDFLFQGGGSTAFTESLLYKLIFAKQQPFTFAHQGTAVDLQPGEWAMLNDLGGGIAVERFAAWLRASEFCAVYADGLTDTLRTIARTTLTQTATRSDLDTIGGNGPTRISTRALFRAEAYGLKGDNTEPKPSTAFVSTGANPVGVSPTSAEQAGLGVRTPDNELIMAPRLVDLEGASIGGAQRYVVVPQFREGNHTTRDALIPVQRESRGLDGVYSLESRRGIHLWKTTAISGPVAKSAEYDSFIDGQNYAADPFVLDDKFYGDFGLAVAAYEHHAFLANIGSGATNTAAPPTTAPLPNTDTQWQPVTPQEELVVTPGAAPVKFYSTSAGIDVMPDGSITITDAWGSQIIMTGGNIVLSCPGDIYRLPGRNDVVLAPGDAIIRAKNDVDVSAGHGDVRIKSEVNTSILAGNSGKGGVLIESRGLNPVLTTAAGKQAVHGGIALKSATDIVEIAEGGVKRNAAQIADIADVVTTEAGNYDIKTSSLVVGTGSSLYLFSEHMMTVPADVIAQGNMHVKGRSRFGGWLYVEKEGIFSVDTIVTKGTMAANGPVIGKAVAPHGQTEADKLPVKDPFDKPLNGDTTTSRNTVRDATNARVQAALDSVIKLDNQLWTAYDKGIGARYTEDVVAALTFSFRLDLEYIGRRAGAGFTLPAAAWQQRLHANAGSKGWLEPVVKHGETYTQPYPGFEAWSGQGNDAALHGMVLLADPVYHDPATQAYVDTTEPRALTLKLEGFSAYITPTK